MKFRNLLFFILILSVLQVSGQTVKDQVNIALGSGNSGKVIAHLDNAVELHIQKPLGSLSKSDAHSQIDQFFTSSKPSRFKMIHHGDSNGGSEFVIGSLSTQSGTYRITYTLVSKGDSQVIKKLKIE